jgi:hypothetical protein
MGWGLGLFISSSAHAGGRLNQSDQQFHGFRVRQVVLHYQ